MKVELTIYKAVQTPGNHMVVATFPVIGREAPKASEATRHARFEGVGEIDSLAPGNDGLAVFVTSCADRTKTGIFFLDELDLAKGLGIGSLV